MGFLHSLTAVAASLKPYEEYVLSGLFLAIGSYAYVEAQSWGFAAGTWPRLTAAIVVVLSTLVFVQDYLPESLQSVIAEGDTMFSRRQKEAVGASEADAPTERQRSDEKPASQHDAEPVSAAVVTALFTVSYAIAGYLIGFLWATPLYIFAFSRWKETEPTKSVSIAAVGFGIAYGFVVVLGVQIEGGILTEVLFP